MGAKSFQHRSTLSKESKAALEHGNFTALLTQLNKLKRLFKQSTPCTKGPSHRHLIALKQAIGKQFKHIVTLADSSRNFNDISEEVGYQNLSQCLNSEETMCSSSIGLSHTANNLSMGLCSTYIKDRKREQLNTGQKNRAEKSLKETVYKYYYQRLTQLTKMRPLEPKPSYMDRVKSRGDGTFLQNKVSKSYEEKFRELMYMVKNAWKPRDYIQRKGDFQSLFCRLCTNIMDSIKQSVCGSNRLESMDRLDYLFKVLKRFKVSSPIFRKQKVYRGGGPKKCMKTDAVKFENWGKSDSIGKNQLSVKVVDSLSKVLKVQFKQEYGLSNVCKLYKASRTSGPVSQILKKFDIKPVPSGLHAVQIHFCGNHYVTSEQKPSGIVVVHDSLVTDLGYKIDLYPQIRYTYATLNQHCVPPKDLIQYETVQHQRDNTSCGIYAVLRAYFILSNKSYTINPDIGRSYLSNVLENSTFPNFDTFSSNYLINNYIRDQRQLQAKKSESVASSTASVKSLKVASKAAKMGKLLKYTTGQQCDRQWKTNPKVNWGILPHKSINPAKNGVKKMGRPVKYSTEERKQRDRESKLRYYHKSKTSRSTATQNCTTPKKCLDQSTRNSKEVLNINSKRIAIGQEQCPPSKQARLFEDSTDKPKKRGRPPKYTPEERKLKNQEKSLKHYHKKRKSKIEKGNQQKEKHSKTMKFLRLNATYREKEKANDKERHSIMRQDAAYRDEERAKDKERRYTKRQDAPYRDEERAKFTEWYRNRRQDDMYRDEERAKFTEWHRNRRQDEVYRDEERAKFTEWHRNRRQDDLYRDEERAKFTEWHRNRRQDDVYRDEERAKFTEWHRNRRQDDVYREEETVKAYQRKYGKNEEDAIRKYLAAIQTGPNVVCTSCLQLWLPDNCSALQNITFPNPQKVKECTTGTLFDGKEWICSTCTRHLKENRIPPISYANGMKFLKIPDELVLVQMEERCLALRQPFFQIRELPNGGQKSIKGNVVNVPMDVSNTINQLPRNLSETETIGIKFKKRLSYKKSAYCENIRPQVVINAAKYLVANSELYKAYNVKINNTWEETMRKNTDENLKTFVEIQDVDQLQNHNDSRQGSCQNIPAMHSARPNQSGGSEAKIIEIDLTMSDDDNEVPEMEKTVSVKCENSTTAGHVGKPDNETVSMEDKNEESDDNFSEVDEMENYSGNMDTMLDSTLVRPSSWSRQNSQNVAQNSSPKDNNIESKSTIGHVHTDADALVIAPGEGQQPISLFNDPDAEYLAFPSIYCGQRRPIDVETNRKTKKRPSNADIYKWELRAQDRRVATCIPNIFFKVKSLQTDAVENVVGISVRKVKGKMQPTAGELKTPQGRDKLRNLNEGVNMFRRMRNTPPYYASKKKSFLAMIRQGGMPALFFTQSCADTRWPELLKVLGKLIDKKDYTDEELENMSYIDRNRLVAADPVTVVRYFENKCHKFQKHIMNLKGSFKQFYRREFQHRGSPHSHEVHWIKEAPIYDPNKPENDQNVTRFIDSWISTEVEVKPEEEKYLKYQIHKHSTSCRKRGEAICRFGIPFFPMRTTTILKPLVDDEVDDEKLQTLKDWYQELRQKLNEMGEGLEIDHEQFLKKINMSETVYILTIRSSLNTAKVFYKRKPNALRVNPYMRGMLAVIKANHDVQYPLNVYALVCYVADYLLKSQRGLSATLEQACRDVLDGDMKLKQQIRHIGYKLLSTIETSAPEACYYIMQIPFTYCSVEVVFIPTSPPEDRTYILKSEEELSEMPEESRDVLKSNSIAAYAKRPKRLHNMCLADYVSELTVQYHKNGKNSEIIQNGDQVNIFDYDENDDDIILSEEEENFDINDDIFPLITKSATFKKRRNPRVIRFVNYSRSHDPENYCREKLLLYMPWRREEMLKGKYETFCEAFEANENIIKNTMCKYEKFAEEVLQAEEMIEATDDDERYDNIAPNTEQGEREDEMIGPVDSSEYGFFRPPKNSEQPETSADILYNAGVAGASDTNIERMAGFMDEDTYLGMVRSLNEKQFQIYTHILHHISKDNVDPLHIFITGGAGVGKSMVLRCVYQGLLRLLAKKEGQNPESPRIIITAPTGKAAYLVEGNTIHSMLKILPSRGNEYIPLSDLHKDSIRIKFRNLNTIIIDEVSMVGNTMLSFIHLRLQEIMENDKPFGGLNVILFGDPYQLSPVMDGWIFEDLESPDKYEDDEKKKDEQKKRKRKRKLTSAAALAPNIWKDYFTCFELTEVMRQKDDQTFCAILNRMREGNHTEEDIRIIKRNCELQGNEPDHLLHVPHFYYSNMERNIHNQKVLLAKEGDTVSVCAIDICTQTTLPKKERERIEANVKKSRNLHETGNLETELKLKVGIPYDMTINVDTEDGLCNGAAFVLRGMLYLEEQRNIPSVLLLEAEDDRIGRKARRKWKTLIPDTIRKEHPGWIPILSSHSQYMYLLKHPIKREQFPLSLAAGKTFHKSQGSSLTQAVMSFPGNRKIAHLHYVGLSRVTKMSGIKILQGQFNEDKIHVHNGVKAEMSRLRTQAKLKLCFSPLSEIASNLLVGSFNAQSLHKHIENVKADWNMKAAMVLGICETRIKQGEDESKYEIEGFEFHHIEPYQTNKRPYHGVAIYVKNILPSRPMFYICTHEFECIARDVSIPNIQSHVQVIMCYRKPSAPNEILFKALQEIVMHINRFQPVIIMGDFNINKEVHEKLIGKMARILKCKQIISDVTTKANTCIDLMFTNMNATAYGSIFTAVSHHHLTYASFEDTGVKM